jgi:hypothetical protein
MAGRIAIVTVPICHESRPMCFASVNIRSLLTIYKESDGSGAQCLLLYRLSGKMLMFCNWTGAQISVNL